MAHAWAKLAQLRVHLTRSCRRLKKGATEEVCGARAFPGLCLPYPRETAPPGPLASGWRPRTCLVPPRSRTTQPRMPLATGPTHTPPCLQAEGASRLLGPRPRGPDAECRVPPARPHSGAPGTNGDARGCSKAQLPAGGTARGFASLTGADGLAS